MERGKYIIFEGGEGCGKSTHSNFVLNYLNKEGYTSIKSREPGGIEVAEKIREILLDKNHSLDSLTELYLFEAARTEFFKQKVIPNLEKGINVISDRSGYSTEAYQGYAGGLSLDLIKSLNKKSTFGIKPDLTFIIDVPVKKGLEKEVDPDRFALKGKAYHKKVNQGYLEIAKRDNCIVIPYLEGNLKKMQNEILFHINKLF